MFLYKHDRIFLWLQWVVQMLLSLMRDKFEGAVMGGDGHIYCVPLRAKHVVKIVPAV